MGTSATNVELTRVTIATSWPMGHRLMDHMGRCRDLHGHNYRLQVTFEGRPQDGSDRRADRGMVADFSTLKKVVADTVDRLDHAMVLEEADPAAALVAPYARLVRVPFTPTAELLARWLLDQLQQPEGCAQCVRVVLWESDLTCAEVSR